MESANGNSADVTILQPCDHPALFEALDPYRAKEGLHLLIDSTGIKVEGEGEWLRRKHGGSKRRIWRKIHIAVDEQTLEIRAVEVTSSAIGDAPVLPDLLNQIAPQEQITSVTADGAYNTCQRRCKTRP